MKRCSTSLIIREMQIKTTLRYLSHLSKCLSSKINKQQMLARMWRKGNPHGLLMGMQTGAATVKTVWRYLKKLKMKLLYDPAIPLLGIYPKKHETVIQKNISTPILIAALVTTTKIWKQPKCPSVDEWIKQLWDIYITEYYLAVKKRKKERKLPFATVWMNLENIMLCEVSQSGRDKYHAIHSYVEPNEQTELTRKMGTDS